LDFKNYEIGNVLACGMRTSNAVAKWTPQLDSAHQIGPSTLFVRFLIVVGRCQKLDFKNHENQKRFGLRNENQQCYGQTDATAEFSASNRSKYALVTVSNCSWGTSEIGVKKRENWRHFGLRNENQPWYGQTDATAGFSASNRCKYALGTVSNCSWGMPEIGFQKSRNWGHFGLRNQNQQCYGETDTTVGFSASNRFKYTLGTDSECSWGMLEVGIQISRKSDTFWLAEPELAMLWPNGRHSWIQRIE